MSVNQQEINYNEKIKESQIQFQDDINDYKMDKKIGEGRFSKVYLAKHKLTSENVAIKIIFKNASTTKEILSHTKSEIEIGMNEMCNNVIDNIVQGKEVNELFQNPTRIKAKRTTNKLPKLTQINEENNSNALYSEKFIKPKKQNYK